MSTDALLRRALDEIVRQREELVALRARVGTDTVEPIAIIGLGCRFPGGADSPSAYWTLLDNATDGTCDVPRARWTVDESPATAPAQRGTSRVRRGGFLPTIDTFDATFFGISPREARAMDPQQRLLLETAWHALEHAGMAPTSLYGSATGVFVGVTCFDHALRLGANMELLGPYAGTGSALNMIPGRLSFLLGLRGPSLAIDTACSSSLVALHIACQSLRAAECEQAIVGGVHLMLSPDVMTSFAQAHMLSPDGWCKTFDARADGYARGEGCGVVVLKRLSAAQDAGDRILGVIRGSAVNQDGPSGGLTVPSGPAQQAVMQRALSQAGLTPDAVDYVEAHGTGTALGDPIEIDALAATYGTTRGRENPLLVGSVKTNIGHLEPAAGMAALAKVLLSFAHGQIPAHRHITQLNPHVAWQASGIDIVTTARPWPVRSRASRAGISAFGFSGTNAHVVVEAPAHVSATPGMPATRPQLLCLSAKSDEALRRLSAAWQRQLAASAEQETADFPAACWTARAGRAHFAHRLALVASTPREALDILTAWNRGDAARCVHGVVAAAAYGPELLAASARAAATLALPDATANGLALADLAAAYVSGADIDWRAPQWGRPSAPVDIPLYPFTPERHWLDLPSDTAEATPTVTPDLASYTVAWVPDQQLTLASRPLASRPLAGRVITVVGEDAQLVSRLVANAVHAGATIRPVPSGQGLGDGMSRRTCTDYIVLPATRDRAETGDAPSDDSVVELLTIAQTAISDARRSGAPHAPARCWVVTRGVAACDVASERQSLASTNWPPMADAARAAAARVVALEHAEHFGRVIDLPTERDGAREADWILRELQREAIDDAVAYRGEHCYVPRLRLRATHVADRTVNVRHDRSYLVTGGFGALGLQVAAALAKAGAGRLLLVGRTGTTDASGTQALQALTDTGTTVVPIRADVTDAAAMRDVLATHDDPARPLAGVFHAAGLGGVRALSELTAPEVRAVLHPKLRGAWVLHDITKHLPLDHFVLFSSIAGVWGSRGQLHYAAANAALEALAQHRHRQELPALAISWGPWQGSGMTSPDAAALLQRIGVQALPADHATAWLLNGLSLPDAHVIVAAMDWPRFRGSYEARGPKGLLTELPGNVAADAPERARDVHRASSWAQTIGDALPAQRTRLIAQAMEVAVREVLGWPSTTAVASDHGLFELGVDSLAALDLKTHLERLLGVALPATLIFQYPTIDALTAFVEGVLAPDRIESVADVAVAAHAREPRATDLVDALSDDEADALLRQTLEALHLPS